MAAGLDVARLNFSHGTHEEHAEVIARIREGEARWGRPIAILQDLQGPKIRLGTFGPGGGGRVDLEAGRPFTLLRRPVVGTVERASITHPEYLSRLEAGDEIWMDDGMIQLRRRVRGAGRGAVPRGGRRAHQRPQGALAAARVAAGVLPHGEGSRGPALRPRATGSTSSPVSFVRSADDIDQVRSVPA